MTINSLSRAILKGGVASLVLVSGVAFAQTGQGGATPAGANASGTSLAPDNAQTRAAASPDSGPVDSDTIVVTGSLIRNPALEASSPVSVVGAAEIDFRQAPTAEALLRDLPGLVPSIGSAVNNGNGGASNVDLRGIGSNRNIVLIDGRRIVPGDLQTRVDLNNVPLALIERVDVLTGGASTTYGADAVSGVVNFVTRRNFEGVEIQGGAGITGRGDGANYRVDLTIGGNFADGKGNVVVSLGYNNVDPVFQGDRPFSRNNIDSFSGLASGGSGTSVPARFSRPGGGTQQINPATGSLVPTFALFNFNPFNVFQVPFERYNMFAQGRYEIAEGIEVYSQGIFSRNQVTTIIAPSGNFGATLTIPYSNPFLPAGARNQFCTANGLDAAQCAAAAVATNPSDPNYRTFQSAVFRRFVEAGTRNSEYTTTLFNFQGGVRGDITDTIRFDLFGAYGVSENIQRQTGNGLQSRVQQAVLATNPTSCIDSSNGCVPLNLFGPAGSITPEQLGFLTGVSTSASTRVALSQVGGVLTGDLGFGLTSNPFGFALGGEYRRYQAFTQSDLATQTPGEVLGNGAANPDQGGSYNVKEVFGELVAPIIEDAPFFKSLTIELGARYSDYSSAGTVFTWKAGGSWEPVDGFKIRGNYNRASRAPNLGELFQPAIIGLGSLSSDPCAGAAPVNNANLRAICLAQGAPAGSIGFIQDPSAGQPNVTTSGNPNLDVEVADTWTAGVVFTPAAIPGFSLAVDYYNIIVNDAISSPTENDAIAACFGAGNPGLAVVPACTAIRRNTTTGGLDGSATAGGLPLPTSNLGRIATEGVDVNINLRIPFDEATLTFGVNGNYAINNFFQSTPTGVNRQCVGFYSPSCASIQPKITVNGRATLTTGMWDFSVLARFIDKVRVEPELSATGESLNADFPFLFAPFRQIGAKTYFDFSVRAQPTENLSVTFSLLNAFDLQPTIVGAGIGALSYNSGNVYPSTYDPLGRRIQVGARLRF